MDDANARWCGRRVLVTGCTGFLGGAVVRDLLARGAEVIGLVRDRSSAASFSRHQLSGRIRVVHGRAEDGFRVHSALAVYEAQAVFHLAAADPAGLDRGTATVLEAVRRYDPRVPVVMARPHEAAPLPPIPVALGVARFGELFGGGDRNPDRIVPATIAGLISGERTAVLTETAARDFVPVADAARACLLLAEALAGQPTRRLDAAFRSGWVLNDREMAAAIREAFVGRLPQSRHAFAAANPLGWAPSTTFADALTEAIHWHRDPGRARLRQFRPASPLPQAA